MPSLIPGYEYDIFISYRHKDNKNDGWVTTFVDDLQKEMESTFKDEVSIYFDKNPHDGLHENYDVDDSLKEKIRCAVFIPIISRTYCDPKSFAWQKEFLAFRDFALADPAGLKVKVAHANVTSRILPVRIHDLDAEDAQLFEKETGSFLRPIDFIFKSTGVNRPLVQRDERGDNQNHTVYRDQINKVAMAIKEIVGALKTTTSQAKIEEPIKRTNDAFERSNKPSRKFLVPALAAAILILLAYAGFTLVRGNIGNVTEEIDRSIAVLPFANMSADKEQEYFSDGLSEELLNLLAKVPDLKVISRTSAFSFKGKNEDIRTIAEKLDVAYLLEGSVRKSDDQLRITAQLIKASDGSHLWSETYDRQMNDIFKVQDEIANAVVDQLKTKLLGDTGQKPRQSRPEVYNLYLQGKFYYNLGTKTGIEKALELFTMAHALDSTDARIAAQLSTVYSAISGASTELTSREMKEYGIKSIRMGEKAIALDPNLADGYTALGYILSSEWDFENSEKWIRKAVEIDPTNSRSLHSMALLNVVLGKFGEAEEMHKKSIELDPIQAVNFFALGNLYQALGKYDESLDMYNKAVELTPRPSFFTQIANLHLLMGNPEQAMIQNNKIEEGFWKDYNLILTLWSLGRKSESDTKLKEFEKNYRDIASYQCAEIYAWRKDADKAFEWLKLAYDLRDPGLTEIKSSVFLKPYRSDPRYNEMLKRLKLPI